MRARQKHELLLPPTLVTQNNKWIVAHQTVPPVCNTVTIFQGGGGAEKKPFEEVFRSPLCDIIMQINSLLQAKVCAQFQKTGAGNDCKCLRHTERQRVFLFPTNHPRTRKLRRVGLSRVARATFVPFELTNHLGSICLCEPKGYR